MRLEFRRRDTSGRGGSCGLRVGLRVGVANAGDELLVGGRLVPRARAQHRLDVLPLDDLLLEQQLGDAARELLLLEQQGCRALVGPLDELTHLLVDELGTLLRERARRLHAFARWEGHVANLGVEAVRRHDRVRNPRHLLLVVLRASRDVTKEELLRDAAAEHHAHRVHHLLLCVELALLGHVLCVAERRHAARHDRNLEQRRGVLQEPADGGVARLVVRDARLVLDRHHLGLLL
mmetsp:Transcript_4826/g.12696  ORF Transcript_4826/g.12696 Transcript_4826/m.12696 type:complete len:235 (-) Transcript_4826:1316-2020(-)